MNIVNMDNKRLKNLFINFIYMVYKEDPNFVDTSLFIVRTFLYKLDSFTKQCYIKPVSIMENSSILAQCIYIWHKDLPYFQVGFFEALPYQQEAVQMLINEAEVECRKLNLKKIVIGLNGHVSYGVGILCDHFDKKITFDSLYNKSYYKDYFENRGYEKQTLCTYNFQTYDLKKKFSLLDRVYQRTSFRKMNMKRFKEDMLLFGKLCNTCLHDTFLYFDREPLCIYELMKNLKPFLKAENIIFALKDGEEIGFIFWHPDYNEILKGGRRNSLIKIGFRYFLNKSKIKNIKVNAIGIVPKYQNTGIPLALMYELYKYAKDQCGESNFVWDNNKKSKLYNERVGNKEDRHYCTYIYQIS